MDKFKGLNITSCYIIRECNKKTEHKEKIDKLR